MGETNEERRQRLGITDEDYREGFGDVPEDAAPVGSGLPTEWDPSTSTTREQRTVDGRYYSPEEWRERTAGGGGGQRPGIGGAYSSYLGSQINPQWDALNASMTSLTQQIAEDRRRAAEQRASLMSMLQGRLKTAQEPVSTETPGIKELLAARRLASQRGTERERAALAERLHAQGLGDSGKFDTGVIGLEQARTESDVMGEAQILHDELQDKRQEVLSLLQMAAQLGDTDAARTLQQQLAVLDSQLQQVQLAEGSRRFDEDLGFRRSSFVDDLGYRLLALELASNANAVPIFMGGGR